MQKVMPIINGTSKYSLRLIDWFVTNYSKKHNTIITYRSTDNNIVHLNVYLSYRSQLKAYSKQQFDPFRRRERILFYYERDKSVETTIGQLNFFRWVIQNHIIDYICEHAKEIEKDMVGQQKPRSGAGSNSTEDAAVTHTTTATTTSVKQSGEKMKTQIHNVDVKTKSSPTTSAKALPIQKLNCITVSRSLRFD